VTVLEAYAKALTWLEEAMHKPQEPWPDYDAQLDDQAAEEQAQAAEEARDG
jgi:hypothetical protein